MTPTAVPAELLDRALALPEAARPEPAHRLFESLDPPPDDPEEVRREWKEEIARRIDDIRAGRVELLDPEGPIARLRRYLHDRYGV